MQKSLVPNLVMQVTGETYENSHPKAEEFQVTIMGNVQNGFSVLVEDQGGRLCGVQTFIAKFAMGVIEMAHTDHELDSDELALPSGFGRTLEWTLHTDPDTLVRLNLAQIEEVARWFEYATGVEVWDWERSREWEY